MQAEDQLLEAMGLAGLEGERREKALENVLYSLNMRLAERLADNLPEEKIDTLTELMAKDTPREQMEEWFAANVPGYEQMVQEEAQKMIDEKADIMAKVMGDSSAQNATL